MPQQRISGSNELLLTSLFASVTVALVSLTSSYYDESNFIDLRLLDAVNCLAEANSVVLV